MLVYQRVSLVVRWGDRCEHKPTYDWAALPARWLQLWHQFSPRPWVVHMMDVRATTKAEYENIWHRENNGCYPLVN